MDIYLHVSRTTMEEKRPYLLFEIIFHMVYSDLRELIEPSGTSLIKLVTTKGLSPFTSTAVNLLRDSFLLKSSVTDTAIRIGMNIEDHTHQAIVLAVDTYLQEERPVLYS